MELIGHRGARGLVAENTLASFSRAMALGVTALELDVYLSSDDTVVVHHDPCLNPEATQDDQGHWLQSPSAPIRNMTFDALRHYRLAGPRPGSEYAQLFPQQRTGTAELVPSLDEVIDLAQASGNSQLRLIIEMKPDPRIKPQDPTPQELCDAIIDVLKSRNMLHRSCLQSFQWQAVLYAHSRQPELPCALLTSERSDWDTIHARNGADSPWTGDFQIRDYAQNLPKMVHATGCRIWSSDYHNIDAACLGTAHDFGLQVWVWTVNEVTDMRRLMKLGVDGIITDYPDRAREIMTELDIPLPPTGQVPNSLQNP